MEHMLEGQISVEIRKPERCLLQQDETSHRGSDMVVAVCDKSWHTSVRHTMEGNDDVMLSNRAAICIIAEKG